MQSKLLILVLFSAVFVSAPVGAQEQGATIVVWPLTETSTQQVNPSSPTLVTTFTMRPSVLSSRRSPYGTGEQTLDVGIACVLLPFNIIVPNCDITLDWQVVNGSGGHEHNTNRPPGHFDTASGASGGSVDPGPPGRVADNSGATGVLSATYAAPEAAGITRVIIRGVAVINGQSIFFGPTVFTIGVQLNGLARPTITGLNPLTVSNMHDHHNGYTNASTTTALQRMVQIFRQSFQIPGQPPIPVPDITLTAASLPQGGLYDFRNEWAPPHVSHRFGNDLDIRIRTFDDNQRKELAEAMYAAGFKTPVRAESPADPNATHWHARL